MRSAGKSRAATPRFQLAAVALLLVVALVAATGSLGAVWTPALILVGGLWAAWTVRRSSVFVAAYVAQCAAFYGLTALISDERVASRSTSLIVCWMAALSVGSLLGARRVPPGEVSEAPVAAVRWPELFACVALVGLHAWLVVTQQVGYASQVLQGTTTPGGWRTIVVVGAPLFTALVLFAALRSRTRVLLATALVVVEALVQSLTGFRGSSVLYLVSVAVGMFIIVPRSRRPPRRALVLAGAAAALLAVSTFVVAAQVKESVARSVSGGSVGGAAAYGTSVEIIANRMDSTKYIDAAVTVNSVIDLADRIGWGRQVTAFVPRLVWPDRPPVDYGVQVSRLVYGAYGSDSSGTVTTIGDVFLNTGAGGVVVFALLIGFGSTRLESRVRRSGRGEIACVAVVAANATFLSLEPPLVLGMVSVVRNTVVFGLLWWLLRSLGRSSSAPPPQAERDANVKFQRSMR